MIKVLTRTQLEAIDWASLEKDFAQELTRMIPAEGLIEREEKGLEIEPSNRKWSMTVWEALEKILLKKTGLPRFDYAHIEGGWCACCCMFPAMDHITRDDIPVAAKSALDAARMTYDYVSQLRDFHEEHRHEIAAPEELKRTLTKLITLTITASNASSNWYDLAAENIINFLDDMNIERSDDSNALITDLVDKNFDSWEEPSSLAVDAVIPGRAERT